MLRPLTGIERESARIVARMFADAGYSGAVEAIEWALEIDANGGVDVSHLPDGDGRNMDRGCME